MASANLENSSQTFHADRNLIAGRYRTHAQIGHGRLGEIFTAIDERYEEPGVEPHVAIQAIPESVVRDNKLFNKLNLGYTILRAIAHPNIVNFQDFGRDGRFGYLVMDLLDGLSLRLVLDDAELLELDEAKPVIRSVGEALRLLHAKNMVHGNLKTSNVFITHELEVQLLDVLPLGSAEPILCDTATSEPFNRRTVEDDVFDLACLAYEMLTGKHPFNHTPPAEARLAGLEAQRIASLTDAEWGALCRALAFDREQRTSSIEEFMRGFGIGGAERLLPTVDQPARHETIVYPTEAEAQPMAPPVTPAQDAATEVPDATDAIDAIDATGDSLPWNDFSLPIDRPTRKRSRPLRAVFLGVLLAGLSAWFFYGEPQENIADLISYVDDYVDVGLTERKDEIVEISTPDPAQSVSTDGVALLDHPAATAPGATGEAMPAGVEATRSELERVAAIAGVVAIAADTNAASMQAESKMVVTESIVSVSERDGAARIAPPHTEDLATPLIWWTSEHTANAGTDFIAVEQQTMALESIGDGTKLYVPLVNDDQPEPPESFFVSFGLRNTQQGQVERIATVRVDIIDDDLP